MVPQAVHDHILHSSLWESKWECDQDSCQDGCFIKG